MGCRKLSVRCSLDKNGYKSKPESQQNKKILVHFKGFIIIVLNFSQKNIFFF